MNLISNLSLNCIIVFFVFNYVGNSAFGIDFKIDLPPQKGLTALTNNSLSALDTSKKVNNNTNSNLENAYNSTNTNSQENASPAQFEEGIFPYLDLNTNNDSLSKSESFPTPVCLAKNVDFWSKIYRDVDNDEAIVHDKYNVARIYSYIKIKGTNSYRARVSELIKKDLQNQILELKNAINMKSELSDKQKQLAALFNSSELNENFLQNASNNIRVQFGLKTRFEAGIQRSLRYLPLIQNVLEKNNLPLDIVFLPHVESSYNPAARSKVGASGLWQIMPGTMKILLGKEFINRRDDVYYATLAAAKLLKQNYMVTRSWPLALTAYNHGLNGINNAIRKTGSKDLCVIIESYNSASFKFASSNFYAQFIAARDLAKDRYSNIAKNHNSAFLKNLIAYLDKNNI